MFPALKIITRCQRSGLLSFIGIWIDRIEMGSEVGLCGVWGLGAGVFECCVKCNICRVQNPDTQRADAPVR
jgi:hypothetical protein